MPNEKNRKHIFDIVYIALFAALIAICSWISIRLFDVPFTLQTFAVFLAVGLLGGKRGTISVVVYILLGVCGVPVFSGFNGGISVILGATGGYIIGFIFSALLMWLLEKLLGKKIWVLALSMVAGLIVCYVFGSIWYMTVYTRNTESIGFWASMMKCVVPFIIPDIVKIALAIFLSDKLRKYVKN